MCLHPDVGRRKLLCVASFIPVPAFIPAIPALPRPCKRGGSLECSEVFCGVSPFNVTFQCHLSVPPFNVTFQGHLSVPPPWLLVVFREALEGCAWPRECGEMRRWIFHPPSSNQSPRLGFLPSSPFVPHSLGVSFLALDLHIWSCPGAGAGLSHIPLMGFGMSQIP